MRYLKHALVIATGRPNPFPPNCGASQRTTTVLAALPQTVEQIEALPGVRSTTIGTLARKGVIAVEGSRTGESK